MKKIFFFLFTLALFSCSDDNDDKINDRRPITFSFEEDGTVPGGTNNLYGVQVYISSSGEEEYKPYAYGLFDNPESIKINLEDTHQYKAECSIIVDGKNKVFNTSSGYEAPFITNTDKAVPLTNSFIISNTEYLSKLSYTPTKLTNTGKTHDTPNVDRYYGLSGVYSPLVSSTMSINIPMKRVVFGVKLKVENLRENYRISLYIEGSPDTLFVYPNSEPELEQIYTLSNFNSLVEPSSMSYILRAEHNGKIEIEAKGTSNYLENTLYEFKLPITYTPDNEALYNIEKIIQGDYYK